jgi:hypothetical protein
MVAGVSCEEQYSQLKLNLKVPSDSECVLLKPRGRGKLFYGRLRVNFKAGVKLVYYLKGEAAIEATQR